MIFWLGIRIQCCLSRLIVQCNKGMFLYINHFSLIIFYHSVCLNYSSLLVQVHSHLVQLSSCAKDMTITICLNKSPDRKWDWSVDDVIPRRDGPENLRILKRRQLRIRPLKAGLGFLPLRHAVEFFGSRLAEMNWDLKYHKMRRMLGWGQHSMVSIGF